MTTEASFQHQGKGGEGIKDVQSGFIICCTGSFCHGTDWASRDIPIGRLALPAFHCTITVSGVILKKQTYTVDVGPTACCHVWSHCTPQPQTNPVPPPPAFINLSSAASVTYFFVWVLTELQPAAALGSGMWPHPNPYLPNLHPSSCHSATTNNE